MNREELKKLVDEGQSTREIAAQMEVGQTTVRYWVKKYELELLRGPRGSLTPKELKYKCKCGETDPSKFYGHKKSICGKCHNQYNLDKGRQKRNFILEKLGKKCVACGYNKYMCSLDVHHIDPTIKDPNYRSVRSWSVSRILKEIESCILLCRNCHAALHNGEDIGV